MRLSARLQWNEMPIIKCKLCLLSKGFYATPYRIYLANQGQLFVLGSKNYIISRLLKILPDVGFAPIFSNDHEEHIALIFT